MSEKTEKATEYKLRKAREKGQVNKSAELNSSLTLLMLCAVMAALWQPTLTELESICRQVLYLAGHLTLTSDTLVCLLQILHGQLLQIGLPFALTGMLVFILVSLLQTGLVWSAQPLVPDFNRLNPIKGLKKIISTKTVFATIKNLLKLTIALIFLFFVIEKNIMQILQLAFTDPQHLPPQMMQILLKISAQFLLLLSIFALADTFYSRWTFLKDQRMSKQELKEEYRQRQGDPKIKQKIKQLQQQLRQKTASLQQVKTADVVITNPTHLAIALRYDRTTMPAPKVICKARGEMASEVRKIAKKHQIPIVENKSFARLLYNAVDLNQWISKEFFPVAASIFSEIYQKRGCTE
jgi:flagellar biosynthetic protein FlhB/flagellar biosynthetic protein FliR/FlhB